MPSSRSCSKVALLMSRGPRRRDFAAFAFVAALVSLAFDRVVRAGAFEPLVVFAPESFEARFDWVAFFVAAAFFLRSWAAFARASFFAFASFSRSAFFSAASFSRAAL